MRPNLRRLCTKSFQIRLQPHPELPELPNTPSKTLIRESTTHLKRLLTLHPSPVILRGAKGVGKSSLLAQAVHHAREQDRIVVYVPNARVWTHGDGFFAAAPVPDGQPHLEGLKAVRFYDRPKQMAELFKCVLEAHGDQLRDIPSNVELRSKVTRDCEDLYSLVALGDRLLDDIDSNWRMNPENAGSVLGQFFEELFVSQRPAAIMIDNYTSFIGMTCMTNELRRRLHANSIRVVAQHLGRGKVEDTARKLNGPVVLADDDAPMFENWRPSRVCGTVDFPIDEEVSQDACGRKWWSDVVKRVDGDGRVVHVPELNPGEQRAICATFGTGRDRAPDRLVALAGGRAEAMRRIYATR